ncbi:hypothetical protein GCM10027053_05910 [Intrasporangium mesophilum]
MKLYADLPVRRTRQLVADILVLLWVALWVWLGRQVHNLVLTLQTPATSITHAGQSVNGAFTGAGDQAGRLPLVGESLEQWLDKAAGAGTTLSDAGTSMSDTVGKLALVLGLITALVPIVSVAWVWLWMRISFVREASSAQRFIDAREDLDLFALRAMATQPMKALAQISDDPAGAWRRQDQEVIRRLAVLELREQGLRPPRLRDPQPR